jgi:hypothetical protein
LASTNAASTSERDWPTLVVGGIFFLIGAIFGAIGLWKLYDAQRTFEGEQAHAQVLRKSIYVDHTGRSTASSTASRRRAARPSAPAAM